MDKVKLGKTGLDVNRICLGTGSFCGSVPPEQAWEQLDYFYAKGGRFVDTALLYCDWYVGERAQSERLLGRWMKQNGCRKDMVVSAKGCHAEVLEQTGHISAPRGEPRLHRADIIGDIERSLNCLQTDYLDIFTLHMDNETVEVGEILETLHEQKQRGVIQAYGCSNWSVKRQRAAYDYAQAHGLDGFMLDQINWSLNMFAPGTAKAAQDDIMDSRAYQFHRETGIPAMAYGASGRGYFHRLVHNMEIRPNEHEMYDCPQNDAILGVLKEASKETGAAINTIVLSYTMLDHGFQVIPILGAKNLEEVDIALAALDYKLPDEYAQQLMQLRKLDA